ncbi:autophagy-related protein 18b isoform X3 [Vigna angularis]|uniref:autophagy-related protein 18b isoform X3 n=1 Tax=Phaseolus angularis TaxID=3914 RepID=UPI00080A6DC4|nr:autophagy-related protein 18b isoform X3 [Vigna angularis]
MANHSSTSSILCASFNQDLSYFAVGTRDGFRIFETNSGKLCYERAVGAFVIVEMLFSSSLIAIVGAGDQPSLSPRRLSLFNTASGAASKELNFLTSILAVRMNRERLVVILQDKAYVYEMRSLSIVDIIDTVPNNKGLCAFSPCLDACYLALPASTTKGSALLYNVMNRHLHCEQSYSFRRGTYPSTIFSLSFGPSKELPDILAASSSSGSIHLFTLGFASHPRSMSSSGFLGSIIPGAVSGVLDPAYHHVLHDAVPAGVKSYVVIRKVENLTNSSSSELLACRAILSVITYNGFFKEYNISINARNELSWALGREFNLLTVT